MTKRARNRRILYTILVVAILAISVILATRASAPDPLPGIALGSKELLIAERSASIFAVIFLAVLVLVRAMQGRLPEELSGRGVKYASSEAVDELRDRIDSQFEAYDRSLEALEDAQRELDERMPETVGGNRVEDEG